MVGRWPRHWDHEGARRHEGHERRQGRSAIETVMDYDNTKCNISTRLSDLSTDEERFPDLNANLKNANLSRQQTLWWRDGRCFSAPIRELMPKLPQTGDHYPSSLAHTASARVAAGSVHRGRAITMSAAISRVPGPPMSSHSRIRTQSPSPWACRHSTRATSRPCQQHGGGPGWKRNTTPPASIWMEHQREDKSTRVFLRSAPPKT